MICCYSSHIHLECMWLPSRHIKKYSATLSHCLKRLQLPCSPALFKTSKFLGTVLNLPFLPRTPLSIVETHSVWERTQAGKRGTKGPTLSPSSFCPLLDAWSSPWEMHIWVMHLGNAYYSIIAVWVYPLPEGIASEKKPQAMSTLTCITRIDTRCWLPQGRFFKGRDLTPSGDLCTLPPPCFLFGGEEFLITPVVDVVHGEIKNDHWHRPSRGCAKISFWHIIVVLHCYL